MNTNQFNTRVGENTSLLPVLLLLLNTIDSLKIVKIMMINLQGQRFRKFTTLEVYVSCSEGL